MHPTLQASAQAMLMQLCHHARNNPAAPKAVARSLEAVGGGEGVDPKCLKVENSLLASSQPWREWARDIARLLLSAMQQWDDSALLVWRALHSHQLAPSRRLRCCQQPIRQQMLARTSENSELCTDGMSKSPLYRSQHMLLAPQFL